MSILILIAFVIMILSYQILQQFHKEVKQAGKQSPEIFSFNFNQSKGNKLYNSYKNGIRKVISVRIHQRPSNIIKSWLTSYHRPQVSRLKVSCLVTNVPYFNVPYFKILQQFYEEVKQYRKQSPIFFNFNQAKVNKLTPSPINIILLILLIFIFNNKILLAEEKSKILVLHVIEENWDDLELTLPKYDRAGEGPKPITKKKALEHFKEYKEENTRINARKSFKGLNNEMTVVADEKPKVIHELKHSLSKGYIKKDTKFFIYHKLRYYGKTYLLKDEDTFMRNSFRFTYMYFNYSYNKIPEKILLLTDPTNAPVMWNDTIGYLYIRLVEDIYILSNDEIGNLKIRYDGKEYDLNVNSMLELPVKETDLTKEEMINFKKYYEDKWGFKVVSLGEGSGISSSKDVFHFGTKVTLINYGYEELE